MDTAQITIVIPVYNRATIVERTLASVAAQTLRPLSVVLVDNNSTDATLEVLQRWAEAHSAPDFAVEVIIEPRPGASNARNAGLARVRTPWTMFFDSDDIMLPDHCASALATAAAYPTAQIIGWDAEKVNANGTRTMMSFSASNPLYHNMFHSSFSTQLYMARTDLFRHVGGWLEEATMYDDCELGMRLLQSNPLIIKRFGTLQVRVIASHTSITASFVNLAKCDIAFNAIRKILPQRHSHWPDLHRLIICARNYPPIQNAQREVSNIIARQSRWRRPLWRLYYRYATHGGRGLNLFVKLLSL